jgi:proteasome-associated ATPase
MTVPLRGLGKRRGRKKETHMPANMEILGEMVSSLGEAPPAARVAMLDRHLAAHPELAPAMAREFLIRNIRAEQGLHQADRATSELRKLMEQMTNPPLTIGGVAGIRDGHCVVAIGNARQEVALHPKLQGQKFEVGDVVAVTQDGGLIVDRLSGYRPPGRVAPVQGWHAGKLLLEHMPDQPIVVDLVPALLSADLREGDRVLYQDEWKIAMELVERSAPAEVEDFPPVHADEIGGLDDQMDDILMAVEGRILYPDQTDALRIGPLTGMLLEGPPGGGKTLLVKALVTHLRERHGKKVAFLNVPPGSWRDPFYGMSERRLVEPLKEAARLIEEAKAEMVIIFYDELDSFGSRSAEVTNRIDSRVLNAFLHALDGLKKRPGILVIGATNRADVCDEALLRPERFGGLVVPIGRPGREAARAIFRCHLRPDVRFWTAGEAVPPGEMVERSIEAGIARLYIDSDPKDALAELLLSGGRRELLWPSQVVSGALIKNVVDRAKRLALRRSFIGPLGLVPGDVAQAADDELSSLSTRLIDPYKAREILGDPTLPIARVNPLRGGLRTRRQASS